MSTLLLTGGTGSFGRAYVEAALADRWHDRVIVFSDGEARQSEMKRQVPPSDRLDYFLGNVRDLDRLRAAMRAGVTHVIHAAALKEVPTCEYDWPEAAKTNVDGSANVAQAAIEAGVEACLLISTDKAVSPVTPYGITKAMAEQWFIRSNRGYGKAHHTRLGAVRYGNVLGSRGSVLHVERSETFPLTDPSMTRFWWTLSHAVAFVHTALSRFGAGEVWVPAIKAAPLLSLAQAMSADDPPRTDFTVIGIRGVEKMHEALVAPDEVRHTCVHEGLGCVVQPANPSWQFERCDDLVPHDFTYTSDDPRRWLSVEELRTMLEGK